MTKADKVSTTSTKSRRDLLTLGAAAAAGAALTAVPAAVKGVVSGNETPDDRTIIALWAERNAIDARAKEMWDAFDVTLTDRKEIARREKILADMDSQAHAIERKILEQDPTTFEGLGIQATILALSVMVGKRGDSMDVSLAEWLFERFAPQELVHIKLHDRSNAAWAASHAEPDLPDPDDAIMALWEKRNALVKEKAATASTLDDAAYDEISERIDNIEAEIMLLEPSAPLHGMRGWGVQAALLAQVLFDNDAANPEVEKAAGRFQLDWDEAIVETCYSGPSRFGGRATEQFYAPLRVERENIKAEREAAFEARRARIKAREQAFLAEVKA